MVLAVKPQTLPQIAADFRRNLELDEEPRVVISILAGTPTQKLAGLLGGNMRLVRAMPNMPAQIRQGVTALCLGPDTTWEKGAVAEALFRGVGQLVLRIDENLMDAFTALAGSGPAYVFFLAQAMVEAGVQLGFDRDVAQRIVQETVAGSGALLAESSKAPSELLAGVQSKGGTTEAAMNVLKDHRVLDAFVAALTAARDRGRQLSNPA